MRHWSSRTQKLFTYAFVSIIVAISAFPFYWMFVVASNDNSVMSQVPPRVVPGGNFVINVKNALSSVNLFGAMLNSFVVAGTITISVVFFSTLAGFALAKLRFKGRKALLVTIIATMVVPQQLGLIPLYMLMAQFGWVNSLAAVIVPGLVTAFGVFWMRQVAASAVPDELLQAARVDGCSTFGLFRHVAVPSVKTGAAVLGLFTFLAAWNEFLWPLVVLQDPSVHTIQIALRALRDVYYTDYAMVMAGTLLSVVPLLVVFVVLSRQMITGVMEGAFKG